MINHTQLAGLDRTALAGWAADCAAATLPVWDAVYPDDDRVAFAIDAVRAWCAGPSDELAAIVERARRIADKVSSEALLNAENGAQRRAADVGWSAWIACGLALDRVAIRFAALPDAAIALSVVVRAAALSVDPVSLLLERLAPGEDHRIARTLIEDGQPVLQAIEAGRLLTR